MARTITWPIWCVDVSWYLETYPDVGMSATDACMHYNMHGCAEKRNPSPFFDHAWYQQYLPYPHMDALEHYLTLGYRDGREPCAHFFTIIRTWVDYHAPPTVKLLRHLDFSRDDGQHSSPLRRVMVSEYYPQIREFAKSYPRENPCVNETLPANAISTSQNITWSCTLEGISNVRISVVYLLPVDVQFVRHFEMWLASFERFTSGVAAYDLVVILKKPHFHQTDAAVVSLALEIFPQLTTLNARFVVHANVGMDVGSWIQFCRDHANVYDAVFFMGTYSIIHSDQWLLKMLYGLYGPSQYVLCGTSGSCGAAPGIGASLPNMHIRTGAFICRPHDMNRFDFGPIVTKMDCLQFEHGLESLTRSMATVGPIGIVGNDGQCYTPRQWHRAGICHPENMHNCLVSDNYIHVVPRMSSMHTDSKLFEVCDVPCPPERQWYDWDAP